MVLYLMSSANGATANNDFDEETKRGGNMVEGEDQGHSRNLRFRITNSIEYRLLDDNEWPPGMCLFAQANQPV